MAITYPITLPATPKARKVRITQRSVVAVGASPFTLQQVVQAHPGQAWQLAITLPPQKRATAEDWIAALISLNGAEGTFLYGDDAGAVPRGIATGTPLIDGAGQTGQTVNTKGWTANQTGILKAGDWFQLGSGATTRLHKVLADANSDAGGLAAIDIWPALRASPADNDPITVNATKGLWRLAATGQRWDIDEAAFYGLDFDAVEAL